MNHLLEVLKIVDGGLSADRSKVIAYTKQLAAKLQDEGDGRAASKLERLLTSNNGSFLAPAELGRVPVDGESRLGLADENIFALSEVEVFLEPQQEEVIGEFIRSVECAGKLLANGVDVDSSLLLYGPPGCGKSALAKHLSARLQLPLLTARTDALISSFLGSTAKNVRLLFEHAMSRPCILFLDELDALAKLRDDQHELGELKRVVISLLQNMDALDGHTTVVAATNHPHLLDPAVWRRFAYKLSLDPPSLETRGRILARHMRGIASKEQIALFAEATDGLTGAHLRQVAHEARRFAVLEDSDTCDEASTLRAILRHRGMDWVSVDATDLANRLRDVRQLNPSIFTYRRLGTLFGISKSYVAKLLTANPEGTADA